MSEAPTAIPVERFEEVDSTNVVARRWAGHGEGARGFVARRQTAGVGRFGRRWHSPEGGLWCSVAWPVEGGQESAVLEGLGLRIGAACRRTVAGFITGGERVRLRWPNDVLVDGKKVCGCLVESVKTGSGLWLIIGVGINVTNDPAALPEGLRTPATSLRGCGSRATVEEVMGVLLRELAGHVLPRAGLLDGLTAVLWGVSERVVAVVPAPGEAGGVRREEMVLAGVDGQGRLACRPISGTGAGIEVSLPPGSSIEYPEGYRRDG